MDNELLKGLNGLKKAIEEGKVAFDASREQSKDRRINEDNDDPIMFVFPNNQEIPENIRKHVENITGVVKDLFGDTEKDLKDVSDKPTGDVKNDVEESSGDIKQEQHDALSNFALFDNTDQITLLIPATGIYENNISIKYIDDELVVKSENNRIVFKSLGSPIAGNVSEFIRLVNVRVSLPDVAKDTTTFKIENGLITITALKKKEVNEYIVK